MTFRDSKLQQHYDSAVASELGWPLCPPEERPIRALIDAYYRFEFEDGPDSPRLLEITEHVLLPELRPALRSWYHRMGEHIHGDAVQVRDRFEHLTGESLR